MKRNTKSFSIIIAILMMFVSNTIVFASASDNFDITNLPTEVKKKIEENLNTNEEPIQSLIENGIIMTRDEFNTFLSKSKSKDDVSVVSGTVVNTNGVTLEAVESAIQ